MRFIFKDGLYGLSAILAHLSRCSLHYLQFLHTWIQIALFSVSWFLVTWKWECGSNCKSSASWSFYIYIYIYIYIYTHIHIAYHLRFLRQKTDFWGQQVTAVCAWIHLFQPMSQWLTFTVYGINVMPLGINSNLTDVVYEIQWWEKHSPHLNQNSDIMSVKTTKSLCVL